MAITDTGNTVTWTDNASGTSMELPVYSGTTGPNVVDVRKVYASTDTFTYDPGFSSTGSCEKRADIY